ncbi:hypothetical protein L211DRAFT_558875 [Terfezia boudieri ATCC MYA-4762]|uniref:Uncharacterized protein n=1 Tax=Terfezia boudieri ATCC MYA-4762 TaxID=1051890 RepID=A0A3N4LXK4_9PEZI|nr:hypothetical protein L211DRAFT_558875 [Terfezia boudieri ATCC MYA-4762]
MQHPPSASARLLSSQKTLCSCLNAWPAPAAQRDVDGDHGRFAAAVSFPSLTSRKASAFAFAISSCASRSSLACGPQPCRCLLRQPSP